MQTEGETICLPTLPGGKGVGYKVNDFRHMLTLLPTPKVMNLKMSPVEVFCCMLTFTSRTRFSMQTNNANPDQTAPRWAVWSGSTLFATETFQKNQQTTHSRRQFVASESGSVKMSFQSSERSSSSWGSVEKISKYLPRCLLKGFQKVVCVHCVVFHIRVYFTRPH